jgi:hypothetical protein
LFEPPFGDEVASRSRVQSCAQEAEGDSCKCLVAAVAAAAAASPPIIAWLRRSLPNWLKPEPKPVGMTMPLAPDPAVIALWRQTAAPLANP